MFITGKDRKAFSDAITEAENMGLMLCVIFNPAFNHFFVELKTPDTQEPLGQSMDHDPANAFTACVIDARQRLNLLGIERYEFQEVKKPNLVIAP